MNTQDGPNSENSPASNEPLEATIVDAPASNEPLDATIVDAPGHSGLTTRQAYNVASDTVAGVNVRVKDNLLQAIAIAACMALGTAIGASVVSERLPGALVGGFAGLIVGFFGSGIFLMIFRALRHIRGRHD